MRPCAASIGRLPCPCDGFQEGTVLDACDTCSHSRLEHILSTTTPPTLESPSTEPTTARAKSVTSLFQSLVKSTPDGSLAVQESLNTFRRSGPSTAAV